MIQTRNKSDRYHQTIARYFFEQRGAPFFLSSTELHLISRWEKEGIPLRVALEGIKMCFERYRSKPGRKRRIRSLAFCQSSVEKAFEAFRERRVGSRWEPDRGREDQKRMKLVEAVERFLASCPDKISGIKMFYSQNLEVISGGAEEDKLEELEQETERLMINLVTEKRRKSLKKKARAEYRNRSDEELERISEQKWIKFLREKYKIPHLSLYYY